MMGPLRGLDGRFIPEAGGRKRPPRTREASPAVQKGGKDSRPQDTKQRPVRGHGGQDGRN